MILIVVAFYVCRGSLGTNLPINVRQRSAVYSALQLSVTHTVNDTFSFPYPVAVKSVKSVLDGPWVKPLQHFLLQLNSSQVSVVFSDYLFVDSLLNWLVSAMTKVDSPVTNLLVVCLDKALYTLLQNKHIASIVVEKDTIIWPAAKMKTNFSQIWITRLVLCRLLNHWGYDVAMFDADAIVLRNPKPLFDKYKEADIVASSGRYPFDLSKRWKAATVCMGTVLLRATSRMEALWDTIAEMGYSKEMSFDDQTKINQALDRLGIQWATAATREQHGYCSNGLSVVLLSTSDVCRVCRKYNKYYVWHQKGSRKSADKVKTAEEGSKWYLRNDWTETNNSITGIKWLQNITMTS